MRHTLQLLIDDLEPSEPMGLVRFGPQRSVGGPQAPDLALLAPILERGLNIPLQFGGQFVAHRVQLAAEHRAALILHRGVELVGCIGEKPHSILDKFCRYRIDRNTGNR